MHPGAYKHIFQELINEYQSVPYLYVQRYNYLYETTYVKKSLANWHLDFLNSNYHKCTEILGIFSGDIEEFKELMHTGFYQGRKRCRWSVKSSSPKSSFTQHGVVKKSLSEKDILKREWKKKKNEDNDNNFWRRNKGPGRWYKKWANNKHRRMQANAMHHGNYDALRGLNSQKGESCYYDWW